MSTLPRVRTLGGMVLDFLFPRMCLGCGREGELLCRDCRTSLPRISPPICPKCGRTQVSGVVCPACIGSSSEIDGIRSPFRFDGLIKEAVHQLKYRNLRALAEPLAGLMKECFVYYAMPGEVLVPVPLHSKRLRERGYNQSNLLAWELGRLVGLPVVDHELVRRRQAPPQARTQSVGQRRANVAGAFACRGEALRNCRVILVDDVATSAATLDACAAALKAGGAASVWGLVLARET